MSARDEKTPRSCLLFHNWALKQTPLRLNSIIAYSVSVCEWM